MPSQQLSELKRAWGENKVWITCYSSALLIFGTPMVYSANKILEIIEKNGSIFQKIDITKQNTTSQPTAIICEPNNE